MTTTIRQYVAIPQDGSTDDAIYPVDTAEQIDTARAALRGAGIEKADVFVGEPGEAHKSGRVLFAD